jgi:hypothetical protein
VFVPSLNMQVDHSGPGFSGDPSRVSGITTSPTLPKPHGFHRLFVDFEPKDVGP